MTYPPLYAPILFSELQLELPTVIAHEPLVAPVDTHKPIGVRLAKLLHQYDSSPSSELWRTIQALSYEILREHK